MQSCGRPGAHPNIIRSAIRIPASGELARGRAFHTYGRGDRTERSGRPLKDTRLLVFGRLQMASPLYQIERRSSRRRGIKQERRHITHLAARATGEPLVKSLKLLALLW